MLANKTIVDVIRTKEAQFQDTLEMELSKICRPKEEAMGVNTILLQIQQHHMHRTMQAINHELSLQTLLFVRSVWYQQMKPMI